MQVKLENNLKNFLYEKKGQKIMRIGISVILASLVLALTGCLKGGVKGAAPSTDDEKTIYSLGHMASQRLKSFDLSPKEFQVWVQGVKDGLDGKESKVDLKSFSMEVAKLGEARSKKVSEKEAKEAAPYLEKMAKEAGATKLDSGVIYNETKAGEGKNPAKESIVKVHYHGTLRDGSVFDSSKDRGTPATFPLNRVIPCWTEAVQKMKVGGTAKVTCPAAQAYGDRGAPPKIKPGAALTFEIELLEIVKSDKKG